MWNLLAAPTALSSKHPAHIALQPLFTPAAGTPQCPDPNAHAATAQLRSMNGPIVMQGKLLRNQMLKNQLSSNITRMLEQHLLLPGPRLHGKANPPAIWHAALQQDA